MRKLLLISVPLLLAATARAEEQRPNVIVVMTDDQGYGDLGVHGNPIVKTPHIDAMAGRSAVLKHFYVSPVCTPTRASLMTGRYNYRTRAIDTFRGRAMMDSDELTVAEILREAGYATGIFGKWHLGDTYTLRAADQGFEESLVIRGGGIGQPSDPPGGEGKYTDPTLFRNGKPVAMRGYCTDIYFTEGMKWAESVAGKGRPFFMYLPTNAPHGPFDDVPPEWLGYYKKQTIAADRFPATSGHPPAKNMKPDTLARVYAMISNIDDNVGRLFEWLDRMKLTERTLVIFMTDNGEATPGYNAGFRGHKADVYEGGVRSPFFAHWPGKLEPGVASETVAAHIDVLPTILDACDVQLPPELKIDGRSIWSLLRREPVKFKARFLFIQSHRGDEPVLYHNFAVRSESWKLVHNSGFGRETLPGGPLKLELFDMTKDPFETRDVASDHPDVVADLMRRYEKWFDDVSQTRPDNYAPPRIRLDTPHEDPVVLTRQDWRGAGWGPKDRGHWEVDVARAGVFAVRLRFRPLERDGKAQLRVGDAEATCTVSRGEREAYFPEVKLAAGPARLQAQLAVGDDSLGVMFVEVSPSR